jgi:cytosine/adenosine deaminase-related metal-dependent hydrolase
VTDLGDVALLPGLVNAHTHLEFSNLQQPLGTPRMAFPDWIRLVIGYRRAQTGVWQPLAVAQGLAESLAAGVALVGEIATYGLLETAPSSPLKKVPGTLPTPDSRGAFAHSESSRHLFQRAASLSPHQVIFAELLGLSAERVEPLWQAASAHVDLPAEHTLGLSPHATYTVHPDLLARVCRLSHERGFPIAMHIAESLDEIELLQSQSGRLVELLDSVGAFPRSVIPRGTRPLGYLQTLSQAARALVIHGNYLAADEIEYLGERSDRMSVVYCPRTHAYFNAGRYPLAEMLAANVNVCLGTDSRASNPDLSLFEELRFVARHHPEVSLEGVLHLGTQAGADALGLGERLGSISPGKSARLAVVPLSSTTAADPHELLFADGLPSGIVI